MPQKIDVPLLKRLLASAPPEAAYDIRDESITGFIVRPLPSGRIPFYAQVSRGKREIICHPQGSGRELERGRVVDAADVLEKKRREITLGWVRKEAKRLQGKVLDGEDFAAERAASKAIPTLAAYLDESTEGTYGWWLVNNRKDGVNTLARLKACFLRDLGRRKLDTLTPAALDAWRTKRLKKVIPETCNRDIGALKAALAKAIEWSTLREHPLRAFKPVRVDRHKQSLRPLSEDEIKALRAALDAREARIRAGRASGNAWREERGYELLPSLDGTFVDVLRPAVEIALETGMRRGELLDLTWQMVDLKGRTIRLPGEKTKSYQSRTIPLNDHAVSILRQWNLQQGRPTQGWVFPGVKGRLTTLKKSFHHVLGQAGIERVTGEGRIGWHSLRHTFGSRLGAANIDPATIKELMGHASLLTTQRYVKSGEARKRAAVEAHIASSS